jgi:uncharacterized protein (DUF4415 family)
MTVSKRNTESTWVDPDDAPELTDEWFQTADQYEGGKLIKRGRPKSDSPKQAISLRVDADVLERYKEGGPGWQVRMNEALRKAVGL